MITRTCFPKYIAVGDDPGPSGRFWIATKKRDVDTRELPPNRCFYVRVPARKRRATTPRRKS
jgi:hypothetical protein